MSGNSAPRHTLPGDIERTSLAIIAEELAARGLTLPPENDAVVRRVIHATADFDVLVEHFADGEPPVPAADANHPHIYWSRSFPDTASLEAGKESVTLTVYALDDTGIASLTVNNVAPENLTQHSEGYWSAELAVEENGHLNVSAVDNAGNRTSQMVTVDWFNTTTSAGAVHTAPDLKAHFEKDGEALQKDDYITGDDTATAVAESETVGVTYSAQRITVRETEEGASELDIEDLEPHPGNGNTFDAKANGYYLITATAKDGTWSQVVLEMTQVDTDLPIASLSLADRGEGEEAVLSWTVTKSNPKLSPITEVYINGYDLKAEQGRTAVGGTFPIQYGGTYTLTAADKAAPSPPPTRRATGPPPNARSAACPSRRRMTAFAPSPTPGTRPGTTA